ncbi:hypothetical protein CH75_04795 [Dyella jiangningensis]|nr:hypothetical protein CH75_04795 [Dyella jiangningensis]
MYQIRHTKPADAAAQILMTITKEGGYWWVHADEDEGFRMAKLGSLYGDQLARSGSPCLTGPYSADISLDALIIALRKAQAAESSKHAIGLRIPFHERDFEGKKRIRDQIMTALDSQAMTVPQMADLFQARIEDVKVAMRLLVSRKEVERAGVARSGVGAKLNFWRKVA